MQRLTVAIALLAMFPAAAAGAPRPDLVVTSIGDPPATMAVAETATIGVTVRNLGKKTAAPFALRLQLSSDAARSDDDTVAGKVSVGALKPSKRSRRTLTLTVPSVSAGATFKLLACADDLRQVKEANERNNCRAAAEPLMVRAASTPPPTPTPSPTATATSSPSSTPTATPTAETCDGTDQDLDGIVDDDACKVTVTLAGGGGGTVTSVPAGISCPQTCSASFPAAQPVQLQQTPDAMSYFGAWSGDCSGRTTCTVTPGEPAVTATFRTAYAGITTTPSGKGYWLFARNGEVRNFGDAGFFGSTAGVALNKPVVGMASTFLANGYWLVAGDGGIFAFGDAGFYGSTGGVPLAKPIVGMAATATGRGYWLVDSGGGIFAFGDAAFFGSTAGAPLASPIVGMTRTPSGAGYWLVSAEGGIFAFGDAGFFGSTAGVPLTKPIVGMAATPNGAGYWIVASDGGIFAYGNAGFYGSTAGTPLNEPIVGMTRTPTNKGYWLTARDGGVFAFGDAGFYGSAAGG